MGKKPTVVKEDKDQVGWGPWAALLVGFGAFFLPQVLLGIILAIYTVVSGTTIDELFTDTSYGLNVFASVFVAIFGTLIIWLYTRKRGGWKALGFRNVSLKKLSWAIPGYFVYFAALIVSFLIVGLLIPEVNLDEAQDIGFEGATSAFNQFLAFSALVIIAPVYEELLFRGFTFQGVAKRFGFWPAAIVVSALFGLAHGQLNVAIDTMLLGIVASWLVWKTKSLYPAILLHGIKNMVAFVVIFVI